LVLSGVLADVLAQAELEQLGVMDSKAFTGKKDRAHKRRWQLAQRIGDLCAVRTVMVLPHTIDKSLLKRTSSSLTLNQIEIEMAAEVIDFMARYQTLTEIVLDGALFNPLKERFDRLRAENKADATDIVVSAASICAKSVRDQLCIDLMGMDGFMRGGGYPNKQTEGWLRDQLEQSGALPAGVRRSWSWCKKVGLLELEAMTQRRPQMSSS
jgi:ribonuclease HII